MDFTALLHQVVEQISERHASEIDGLNAEIARLKAENLKLGVFDSKAMTREAQAQSLGAQEGSHPEIGPHCSTSIKLKVGSAELDDSPGNMPEPESPRHEYPAKDGEENQAKENETAGEEGLKTSIKTKHSDHILGQNKTMPSFANEEKILHRLIFGPRAEMFFSILVLTNVLAMALESQYDGMKTGTQYGLASKRQARNEDEWPHAEGMFTIVSWAFGISFTAEIVAKIAVSKTQCMKDAASWLDLFVVCLWLADVLGIDFGVDMQFARLLRLAKLLRLMKLVRTIRSFDALWLISTAMRGSLMTLLWTIIIFTAVLTFFAMLMTQMLLMFYFNDASQPLEQRQELYVFFGTFSRSLFTMFELTFANWPPVSRLLAENVSEWFFMFAVLCRLTLGFAMVGVCNGVFMQETFKVAAADDNIMVRQYVRDAKLHQEKMARLFTAADTSMDGVVSKEELKSLFNDEGVRNWLSAMSFPVFTSEPEINCLYELIDTDGSGSITLNELAKGVSHLRGAARSFDLLVCKTELVDLQKRLAPDLVRHLQISDIVPPSGPMNLSTL